MNTNIYQECINCVMDTSDKDISFDSNGLCNYCQRFENEIKNKWHPGDEEGKRQLEAIVNKIKKAGKNQEYDCILGLSGGVDSSYLAYMAKKLELKPLIVHVDCGWNSELAVKNIENVCKYLGFDLHTHVVDWEEMKDVQASFFRAGVPNQDIPQDHAIFAALYKYAEDNKIHYVLNGGNIATESILPSSWGYSSKDGKHLIAIHKKYGKLELHTFPVMGILKYYFYYPYIWKMKIVRLLNYVDYNKSKAIQILENELGWRYYGGKHYESRFTKFFQSYYLPVKFGFDKRRAHLSSLIVSGQISREQAKKELELPLYNEEELRKDKNYVLKKLGITEKEFTILMDSKNRKHSEYPSSENVLNSLKRIKRLFKTITVLK